MNDGAATQPTKKLGINARYGTPPLAYTHAGQGDILISPITDIKKAVSNVILC